MTIYFSSTLLITPPFIPISSNLFISLLSYSILHHPPLLSHSLLPYPTQYFIITTFSSIHFSYFSLHHFYIIHSTLLTSVLCLLCLLRLLRMWLCLASLAHVAVSCISCVSCTSCTCGCALPWSVYRPLPCTSQCHSYICSLWYTPMLLCLLRMVSCASCASCTWIGSNPRDKIVRALLVGAHGVCYG
jgi:hypothetical protein